MSKVLLVDRDGTRAQAIRAVLERNGYEIVVAADGNEGLRRFLDELPELVMVGAMAADPAETFCARLRETRPGSTTPLVFYAASLRGNQLREALERTGCNVYLEMPASDQRLVEVCRHTLMESGHSVAEDGGGPAFESPDAAVDELASRGPDIEEHLQSMFETGAPPTTPKHAYEAEARPEARPAGAGEPALAIDFPDTTHEPAGEVDSASLREEPSSDSVVDPASQPRAEPPVGAEAESPTFDPEDTLPTLPSRDDRPGEFGFEVEDVAANPGPSGFDLADPPEEEPGANEPVSPLDDVGFSVDEPAVPEPPPVAAEPPPATHAAPFVSEVPQVPEPEAAVVEPMPDAATATPPASSRGWLWTAAAVVLLAGGGALFFTFGPALMGEKPARRHVARTPESQPVHPSGAVPGTAAGTASAATDPEPAATTAPDLATEATPPEPDAAEIEEATAAMLAADAMNSGPEIARVDPAPAESTPPAERTEPRESAPAVPTTSPAEEIAGAEARPVGSDTAPEPEVPTATPTPAQPEAVTPPKPAAVQPPPAKPDPVEPAYVPSTETVELADTPIPGYTPPKPVRKPKPDFDPSGVPEGGETVVLRVLVNDWGKVVRVVVDQGSSASPRVDAAVDAVLNTRYEPAVKNGREVRAWTIENFHFAPR